MEGPDCCSQLQSAGKANIDDGYEVAQIARSLDFINVMTYDFHGAWEQTTGHNSPLTSSQDDTANVFTLAPGAGLAYRLAYTAGGQHQGGEENESCVSPCICFRPHRTAAETGTLRAQEPQCCRA
jgi:hypothetical protein